MKHIEIKTALFFVALFVFCAPIAAQNFGNPDSSKPLEITADASLEWHRGSFFFRASKNVKAVQGTTTLLCETLTAYYREGERSGLDIYKIVTQENVQIVSDDSRAYGDAAIYDIDEGYAIMTGGDLRLVSSDQVVTAKESFEYWVSGGRLVAKGEAKAVRGDDQLKASKIIAIFAQNAAGKRVLKSLEAIGNVVITTPTETLKGERATFDAASNLAQIHDNVSIARGPNILQGDRAQVNLNTNISKIFSATGQVSGQEGDRVRGVFYPGTVEGAP